MRRHWQALYLLLPLAFVFFLDTHGALTADEAAVENGPTEVTHDLVKTTAARQADTAARLGLVGDEIMWPQRPVALDQLLDLLAIELLAWPEASWAVPDGREGRFDVRAVHPTKPGRIVAFTIEGASDTTSVEVYRADVNATGVTQLADVDDWAGPLPFQSDGGRASVLVIDRNVTGEATKVVAGTVGPRAADLAS